MRRGPGGLAVEEGHTVTEGLPLAHMGQDRLARCQSRSAGQIRAACSAGQTLPRTVSYVSPRPKEQAEEAKFKVGIGIEPPAGVELRSGMTAVSEVVARSDTNVLLIPHQALRESQGEPVMLVLGARSSG